MRHCRISWQSTYIYLYIHFCVCLCHLLLIFTTKPTNPLAYWLAGCLFACLPVRPSICLFLTRIAFLRFFIAKTKQKTELAIAFLFTGLAGIYAYTHSCIGRFFFLVCRPNYWSNWLTSRTWVVS